MADTNVEGILDTSNHFVSASDKGKEQSSFSPAGLNVPISSPNTTGGNPQRRGRGAFAFTTRTDTGIPVLASDNVGSRSAKFCKKGRVKFEQTRKITPDDQFIDERRPRIDSSQEDSVTSSGHIPTHHRRTADNTETTYSPIRTTRVNRLTSSDQITATASVSAQYCTQSSGDLSNNETETEAVYSRPCPSPKHTRSGQSNNSSSFLSSRTTEQDSDVVERAHDPINETRPTADSGDSHTTTSKMRSSTACSEKHSEKTNIPSQSSIQGSDLTRDPADPPLTLPIIPGYVVLTDTELQDKIDAAVSSALEVALSQQMQHFQEHHKQGFCHPDYYRGGNDGCFSTLPPLQAPTLSSYYYNSNPQAGDGGLSTTFSPMDATQHDQSWTRLGAEYPSNYNNSKFWAPGLYTPENGGANASGLNYSIQTHGTSNSLLESSPSHSMPSLPPALTPPAPCLRQETESVEPMFRLIDVNSFLPRHRSYDIHTDNKDESSTIRNSKPMRINVDAPIFEPSWAKGKP